LSSITMSDAVPSSENASNTVHSSNVATDVTLCESQIEFSSITMSDAAPSSGIASNTVHSSNVTPEEPSSVTTSDAAPSSGNALNTLHSSIVASDLTYRKSQIEPSSDVGPSSENASDIVCTLNISSNSLHSTKNALVAQSPEDIPFVEPVVQKNTETQTHYDLPYENELLCFVQNKMNTLPLNIVVKLCTDFYSCEEIAKAKTMLFNIIPTQRRKITRIGAEKAKMDMNDIMKVLLECQPQDALSAKFVASNLSNLPPVGVENCDLAKLHNDIDNIRNSVTLITQNQKHLFEILNFQNIPSTQHLQTATQEDIGRPTADSQSEAIPKDNQTRSLFSTLPESGHVKDKQITCSTISTNYKHIQTEASRQTGETTGIHKSKNLETDKDKLVSSVSINSQITDNAADVVDASTFPSLENEVHYSTPIAKPVNKTSMDRNSKVETTRIHKSKDLETDKNNLVSSVSINNHIMDNVANVADASTFPSLENGVNYSIPIAKSVNKTSMDRNSRVNDTSTNSRHETISVSESDSSSTISEYDQVNIPVIHN
jgi:hypothetical protein